MNRLKGFTLIELMIVVAVIAILSAIALPSYQDHIRKGKRAAAKSVLADLANREQAYLNDKRAYGNRSALVGASWTAPPEIVNDYTFDVTPDDTTSPPSFLATATPTSTLMLADRCGTSATVPLSLDQAGAKTPAACW